MQDSALKEYIGQLVNDIIVFHKTCSPAFAENFLKLRALTKAGPFKTIPTNSSLEKVVLLRRSKRLYLFTSTRSGPLFSMVARGMVAGVEDPTVIRQELLGQNVLLPMIKNSSDHGEPSLKKPRRD